MANFNANYSIKGLVTFQRKKADTLELIEEVEVPNTITYYLIDFMFTQYNNTTTDPASSFTEINSTVTGQYRAYLQLHTSIEKESPTSWFTTTSRSDLIYASSYVLAGRLTQGDPMIYEVVGRWNPPVAQRTIWGVSLGKDGEYLAWTTLSVPCIQETDEVLDVTYRVIINFDDVPNVGNPIGSGFTQNLVKPFFWQGVSGALTGEQHSGFPMCFRSAVQKTLPEVQRGLYRAVSSIIANERYDVSPTWPIPLSCLPVYKRQLNLNWGITEKVGHAISTIAWGHMTESSGGDRPWGRNSEYEMWAPATPDGFIGKPVQPIHNHSADALEPFQDVDYLASAAGQPLVNGDNWTDPDWPKFYRVEYTTSGDVGTATYFYRKRNHVGFQHVSHPMAGSTYVNTGQSKYRSEVEYAIFNHASNDYNTNCLETYDVGSGRDLGMPASYAKIHEYDTTRYIIWDDVSVSITNILTGEITIFEFDTYPAFNPISIQQAIRDNDGSIWVQCTVTGLWKIENPLSTGSPAVNIIQFTSIAHGIPDAEGTDIHPPCYGICEGYNGRIWAVFKGGMSYTDNGGVSFTNLNSGSPELFVIPSITDALDNWQKIQYIDADREAPNHELAIVYHADGADVRNYCYWWSPANGGTTTYASIGITPWRHGLRCSYSGSVWAYASNNGNTTTYPYYNRTYTVRWGIAAGSQDCSGGDRYNTTTYAARSRQGPHFIYDYYGVPYILAHHNTSGTSANGGGTNTCIGIAHPSGNHYFAVWPFIVYPASGTYDCAVKYVPERNGGDGSYLWYNSYPYNFNYPYDWTYGTSVYQISIGLTPWTYQNGNVAVGSVWDTALGNYNGSKYATLDAQYHPSEEWSWKKYHWNGAAWQKDYYAPAVDSAGNVAGPFNAVRHNFNTESHYFTGRSMIDASSVFAYPGSPDLFASGEATFAFTVTGNDKLGSTNTDRHLYKHQERYSVIFDIANTATDGNHHRVMLYWDDSTGKMLIQEDLNDSTYTTDILTPTPTPDVATRVVVVFTDGTASPALGSPMLPAVRVYVNASDLPVHYLQQPFDFVNGNGGLKFFIGCRAYDWFRNRRVTQPWMFYRGDLNNIQIWNVGWTQVNVTDDNNDISGVLGTIPASYMIARWQLNEALTETKTTHAGYDALDDGLTIAFTNGLASPVPSPAFTAGEYHTFGVMDGILKDNATQFAQNTSIYTQPVNPTFATICDPAGNTTIPNSSTQVTERVEWAYNGATSYQSPLHRSTAFQGDAGFNYSSSGWNDKGVIGAQYIDGDGYFEFTTGITELYVVGLGATTTATLGNCAVGLRFNEDGGVDLYASGGGLIVPDITTYEAGDRFRLERVGTTVKSYKYVGATPVEIHAGVTDATVLHPMCTFNQYGHIINCVINWTQPAYMMRVGDPLALTGAYDPNYLVTDMRNNADDLSITIGGTPATIIRSTTFIEDMTAPGPGEVSLNETSGHLLFNAADVGSSVTGSLVVVYWKQ